MTSIAWLLLCLASAALGAGGAWTVLRPAVRNARSAAQEAEAARSTAEAEVIQLSTALDYERRAAEEGAAAEARLKEAFAALSHEALDRSKRDFLELAAVKFQEVNGLAKGELEQRKQAVEALVAPMRESLGRVEKELRDLESLRNKQQGELSAQLRSMTETNEKLRVETASLVTALRKPQARGRWGEMQLRRVVELGGMVEHCDFVEQDSTSDEDGRHRPDMCVRLTGGRQIVVDSKVPLEAFLDVADAVDEAARKSALERHARHLKAHADALSKKDYGHRVEGAPEYVVMFVPGEALLSAAMESDPGLIDHAAERNVLIATPTTLIAMLRTISFSWTQVSIESRAREIHETARELYDRLATMGGHVEKLGRALRGSVAAYNETVGSLESRVLPKARQLRTLKVSDAPLPDHAPLTEEPRPLTAAELVESAEAARPLSALPETLPLMVDDELRRVAGLD